MKNKVVLKLENKVRPQLKTQEKDFQNGRVCSIYQPANGCCTLHTLVEILIFAVIPVFPLFYMFPLHFDAKRGEKEARDSLLQGSFSNLGKGCQNEI